MCCCFVFYLYHIKIASLCMGWYHMQVKNPTSYFIIWKVIKCIFIIIKWNEINIFVHIFMLVDNSQSLPIASRIILSMLPHFRFYRKSQLCKGLGKIRSCFFFLLLFLNTYDVSTTIRATLHLYIPFQIWIAVYASCFSSSWWSRTVLIMVTEKLRHIQI